MGSEMCIRDRDESGGADHTDVRLRRCGWGLAIMDSNNIQSCLGGWYGNVVDEPQTTLKATITGALFALRRTSGDLTLLPDAQAFINGFFQATGAKTHGGSPIWTGPNAELWQELRDAVALRRSRGDLVRIIKVKAHMTEAELRVYTGPMAYYYGNKKADEFAGYGADLARAPLFWREKVQQLDQKARTVLARIVDRNAAFLALADNHSRDGARPHRGEKRISLQIAISQSSHSFSQGVHACSRLAELPNNVECTCCHQRCSRSKFYDWVKSTECIRPQPSLHDVRTGTAAVRPVGGLRIGNSTIHPTHNMRHRTDRGWWWCSSCGSYTTTHSGSRNSKSAPKALLVECKPATRSGLDKLSRINKGLEPNRSRKPLN